MILLEPEPGGGLVQSGRLGRHLPMVALQHPRLLEPGDVPVDGHRRHAQMRRQVFDGDGPSPHDVFGYPRPPGLGSFHLSGHDSFVGCWKSHAHLSRGIPRPWPGPSIPRLPDAPIRTPLRLPIPAGRRTPCAGMRRLTAAYPERDRWRQRSPPEGRPDRRGKGRNATHAWDVPDGADSSEDGAVRRPIRQGRPRQRRRRRVVSGP